MNRRPALCAAVLGSLLAACAAPDPFSKRSLASTITGLGASAASMVEYTIDQKTFEQMGWSGGYIKRTEWRDARLTGADPVNLAWIEVFDSAASARQRVASIDASGPLPPRPYTFMNERQRAVLSLPSELPLEVVDAYRRWFMEV